MSTPSCWVCGAACAEAFGARLLGSHEVRYFHCARCDHVQTQSPHWLAQAYASAISRADTGLVLRNLQVARMLACVIDGVLPARGPYLDVAGGTGLLTRRMRDLGFDFRWEDPYCVNALASGFEAEPDSSGYEAVSAIEVLEHLPDPVPFVKQAIERSATGTLIATTELTGGGVPPREWPYYAFGTGQHVSFFARRTLETLAHATGTRLVSDGYLHMFTRLEIDERRYRLLLRRSHGRLFDKVAARRASLTQADHEHMLARAGAHPTT